MATLGYFSDFQGLGPEIATWSRDNILGQFEKLKCFSWPSDEEDTFFWANLANIVSVPNYGPSRAQTLKNGYTAKNAPKWVN